MLTSAPAFVEALLEGQTCLLFLGLSYAKACDELATGKDGLRQRAKSRGDELHRVRDGLPIFARGKLVAGLRVAEAEEEKARLAFQQSLYNAGAEVSNALALYEASEAKIKAETLQIESLEKNVEIVETLFKTGKTSSYLEVITAQQALLQAQLSQIRDRFSKMQAVVNLYNALGGGAQ